MRHIYLDNVHPLTIDQRNERSRCREFIGTKFYVNRLPGDVYIRLRSGLMFHMKPQVESTYFGDNCLYVCDYVECPPDVKEDFKDQARRTSSTMRQCMHHGVLGNWTGVPPATNRYNVEHTSALTLEVILECEGIVYLEDHDVVVMYGLTRSQAEKIYHPYSRSGYTEKSLKHIRADNHHIRRGDMTFNIRIVDNSDTFGSRWLLIGDKPFCVVACKDPQVTDGIYITYTQNTVGGKGPQKLLTDRYEFKDGANLPYYKLYETQHEALLARQGMQAEEAQARIRELETKASTAETNFKKAQQERENLERESQLRAQKHEQELDKLRKEREKLQREHELFLHKNAAEIISTSRKNTIELIKYVPVIVSAVAYIGTLMKRS